MKVQLFEDQETVVVKLTLICRNQLLQCVKLSSHT